MVVVASSFGASASIYLYLATVFKVGTANNLVYCRVGAVVAQAFAKGFWLGSKTKRKKAGID